MCLLAPISTSLSVSSLVSLGHVWLDVIEDSTPVPLYRGTSGSIVVCKLTRLESYFSSSQPTVSSNAAQQVTSRQTPTNTQKQPTPTQQPTVPSVPTPKTESLLFDVDPSTSPSPPPASSGSNSAPTADFLNSETSHSDELLSMGISSATSNKTRGTSAPVVPVVNSSGVPAPVVVDPFGGGGDILQTTSPKVQRNGSVGSNGNKGTRGNGNATGMGNMQGGQNGQGSNGVMQGNFGAFDMMGNGRQNGYGNRNGRGNSTWN